MNQLSIKIGNFRLTNISRFGAEYVDIKEGVAIEKECSNGKAWYVIAFVRFDIHEGEVFYDCVGTRLTDNVDASEWPIVKELLECGVKIVETANKELDD